jgi:hypothetical protein
MDVVMPSEPGTPQEATLYVNKSDSRCGACNRGADPYEETHESVEGWFQGRSVKGCGARFTSVSSDYNTITGEDAASVRPDLPWVGYALR